MSRQFGGRLIATADLDAAPCPSQATARPRLWASRDPNKATSGFEPLYEALQASA